MTIPPCRSRTRARSRRAAAAAATLLKDPLWYAAKWGGFKEETRTTANDLPDIDAEWDANGDGNPDNYFLVTNALNLGAQLASAFDEILSRTGSASSASVNSGSISSDTRLYQAKFNSGDWSGQLLSFTVNADGSLDSPEEWEASEQIPAPGSRKIITVNSNGRGRAISLGHGSNPTTGLDAIRRGQLGAAPAADRQLRLNYLRGDGTREDQNVYRNQHTAVPRSAAASRRRPQRAGRHRLVGPAVRRQAAVPVPRHLPGRDRNPVLDFRGRP